MTRNTTAVTLVVTAVTLVVFGLGASFASAQTLPRLPVGTADTAFSADSFSGPARRIMRLSDGKIYGTF